MITEPTRVMTKGRPQVSPKIRAVQHLILQGFTLYTARAAVCTRLAKDTILDDPSHTWAVIFDNSSSSAIHKLEDSDPLKSTFSDAAIRSMHPTNQMVVCSTLGVGLLLPLEVDYVRDAKMKIQSAIARGKAPTADKLESFPDELIEQEFNRRNKSRGL